MRVSQIKLELNLFIKTNNWYLSDNLPSPNLSCALLESSAFKFAQGEELSIFSIARFNRQ